MEFRLLDQTHLLGYKRVSTHIENLQKVYDNLREYREYKLTEGKVIGKCKCKDSVLMDTKLCLECFGINESKSEQK